MYLHALFSHQRIRTLEDLGTSIHPVESALCHLTDVTTPLSSHTETCYFARASWYPPLCVAIIGYPNRPTDGEWHIVEDLIGGGLVQKTFRISRDHILDDQLLRALREILHRAFALAKM